MTDDKEKLALTADNKRQAVDSLRGYVYQIWHSVHAWLELSDEEILFLEGAEDFDIVDREKGKAVQVKDTAANITLRSQAVMDAIANFSYLRTNNPDKAIRFKFLTRSQIGIEKGQPFGKGVAGLNLWKLCSRELDAVEKIRDFLLQDGRMQGDLHKFLSNSDAETILEHLILPITWETGSRDASYVEQAIERKLVLHGDKYGIPPSKSAPVINRLLKEALTRASQKSQRFLDRALFLRIFEEETTIRVPAHQLQAFSKDSSLQNAMISGFFQADSDLNLQLAPLIYSGVPLIHGIMAPREMLTNDLCSFLNETSVLILIGSVGMGKTTLAKMVAIEDRNNWYWLNASNRDPLLLSSILHQLGIFIERERIPMNIVLDDFDFTPGATRQYDDYFGGLLYTLADRGGRIIITSRKSLPERLSHNLGLNQESFYQVPLFTQEEITDFALRLGCKEQKLARSWAKVILLHTKGHPQLVHARLLNLSGSDWPSLTQNDLSRTPSDILQEQAASRNLLMDQLSGDECELIYRLSAVSGLFRRDQAITIAENKPTIERPGDVFDRLVGPWIESFHSEYYHLSPLLENAAIQIWSKEKIKLLHTNIAQAILSCGKLTTLEAEKILLHAWTGRDSGILAYSIQVLLTSPENVWKSMVHDLSWLIYIGLEPIEAPFPENAFVNFVLRLLQFRIAVEVDPKTAVKIAEAWDKENTSEEHQELYIHQRFLIISQLIIYYQVEISPSKLISLFVELAELLNQPGRHNEILKNLKPPSFDSYPKVTFDLITHLFIFMIPRCSGISFLNELLESLENISEDIRKRMLNVFNMSDSEATLLINSVWMKVADSEEKDWDKCIEVFEKTIKFAMQWDVDALAIAAARGIAIVYEEYLNDPSQAFSILDKVNAQINKSSILLEDGRATVHFHHDSYNKALAIWEKIIPNWTPQNPSDMVPIFACRRAGVSAAHTDDWKKAFNFFKEGFNRSEALINRVFSAAFLADAGFALWKLDEYKELLNTFEEVLKRIDKLPNRKKKLAVFTLNKLVAHILLWIVNSLEDKSGIELADPKPGMCSNPDHSEKIRELPDTPIDFSWMHLSKIEYHYDLGSSIFKSVYKRFINSPYPSVRFFLALINVKHSFRLLQFDSLPVQIHALDTCYQISKKHFSNGKEVWEESTVDVNNKILTQFQMSVSGLFLVALVSMAGADKIKPTIFKIWRKNAKNIPRNNFLIEYIDLAEKILSLETADAFKTMADKDKDREIRLLGALKVSISDEAPPNEMFYAHTLLVNDLLQGPWANDVAEYLANLISKQWLKKTKLPFALISPRFTVPEIEEACKNKADGMQKSAKILLTVSNAVSTRLPQEMLTQLHNLAKNQK